MTIGIDMVVLSSNEHENFLPFWPCVSRAYQKLLPEVEVHLAFVTDRPTDDPFIAELRFESQRHGTNVTVYPLIPGVPSANQAKMARHFHASLQGAKVCYLDDIDLFPLSRKFIVEKVQDRKPNHLLCVGAEFFAYGNTGVFSISQMTAEGEIFQKLFNPRTLDWQRFIKSFVGLKGWHPTKLDIANQTPSWDGACFSDEYLVKHLLAANPVQTHHKPRGFDWERETPDRAFWGRFDIRLLKAGKYVFAHCVRPLAGNEHLIQPLINFVEQNF